jgi:hypothetical protein
MVDEVDEKPPLTKEERRQRQKKLEQARRRQQSENVPAVPAPAGTEVGTEPGEAPAKRRGRPKRRPITASDLQGLKCFEKLAPLLERLHDVGCERDQAGNVLSQPERDRIASLLRDHRLYVDQPVDRPQGDETDL